jgi:hypothetical protein
MADEAEKVPEKAPATKPPVAAKVEHTHGEPGAEHYEEVSEYRIGEGPPPLPLIVCFVIIVIWASISWVPFFGY